MTRLFLVRATQGFCAASRPTPRTLPSTIAPVAAWQRRTLASGGGGRDKTPARNEHAMPEGGSPDDLAHSQSAFNPSDTRPQDEARQVDAEKGTELHSRSAATAADGPSSTSTHHKGEGSSKPDEATSSRGQGDKPPTSGHGNQRNNRQ